MKPIMQMNNVELDKLITNAILKASLLVLGLMVVLGGSCGMLVSGLVR